MIKYLLESVVFFAIISVIPSISYAEDIDTASMMNPDTRARYETQYMVKELALDSSTAASVHEINMKYAKENQEIMTSDKKNAEKIKEIKKNSTAKDAEMKKVLTDDQYKKYTETKTEMMKMVKEKIKEKK